MRDANSREFPLVITLTDEAGYESNVIRCDEGAETVWRIWQEPAFEIVLTQEWMERIVEAYLRQKCDIGIQEIVKVAEIGEVGDAMAYPAVAGVLYSAMETALEQMQIYSRHIAEIKAGAEYTSELYSIQHGLRRALEVVKRGVARWKGKVEDT